MFVKVRLGDGGEACRTSSAWPLSSWSCRWWGPRARSSCASGRPRRRRWKRCPATAGPWRPARATTSPRTAGRGPSPGPRARGTTSSSASPWRSWATPRRRRAAARRRSAHASAGRSHGSGEDVPGCPLKTHRKHLFKNCTIQDTLKEPTCNLLSVEVRRKVFDTETVRQFRVSLG